MRLFQRRWSSNCIKRNTMVQIAIATLTFLMLVRVWPYNLVQRHTYSRHQHGKDTLAGERFTYSDKKLQTITFSQDHIYQIRLYMNCVISDDVSGAEMILFRLYNDDFSCIYEEKIDSRSIEKNGGAAATPDLDVDIGTLYYYEVLIPEESHAVYELPVAGRNVLAQEENGVLYIDGIYNDEESLVADFDYSRPLTVIGILLCDILILGFALLVYFLVSCAMMLYDRKFAGNRVRIRKYFCLVMSGAALLAALFLIVYAVILNKFGGELWDRLFFLIGIAAALAWVLSALWIPVFFPKKKQKTRMSVRGQISFIWRNYIQTVCFGLLFYALCQYVNADRNFYHYTNTRWMLIFLAIALLMNYNERQLVNWFSAIWLVLGLAGSVIYCGTVQGEENELVLARLTCGVVTAWGLLVINILLSLVRTKDFRLDSVRERFIRQVTGHRQQTVYVVLWVIFCLLMYVNRFEKVWVFTATLPFLAFLFMPNSLLMECRFLKNFSNGILLSFVLVTLFCYAHRPHHYWIYYRYGGIFHTVACTGMYLAVVFGVAVAKLYGKLRNRRNIMICCHAEYFVTACVVGFILLTMSRTAFLTVTVTLLAVVILAAVVHRKSVQKVFVELGVLAAVSLLSFPMVYSSVRMIPAVVNDPVHYAIEIQNDSDSIYKGDPIDSDKYITVRRFFTTLFGRFQTSEQEGAEADAGSAGELYWQEIGELAYTGDDFAGMDIRQFSGDSAVEGDSGEEKKGDISNGRFEIFLDYIKAIEWKGHPRMGPIEKDGNEYSHAHNSYLQVAYNFGLAAGVLFLILCALTLWRSVRFAWEYGKKSSIVFIPLALIVAFGFISLTEWVFHPCIPAGFSFILMQIILMRTDAQGK